MSFVRHLIRLPCHLPIFFSTVAIARTAAEEHIVVDLCIHVMELLSDAYQVGRQREERLRKRWALLCGQPPNRHRGD